MTTITEPAVYEIHIEGYLDRRRVRQFGGMTATRLPDGVTALVGPVADQAALHGLIGRIRDLGTPLLLVRRISRRGPDMRPVDCPQDQKGLTD